MNRKENTFVFEALEDAIVQIDYLRSRLSAKEYRFTTPTCEETINKLKQSKLKL